jgi:hypothetical protein
MSLFLSLEVARSSALLPPLDALIASGALQVQGLWWKRKTKKGECLMAGTLFFLGSTLTMHAFGCW